MSDYKNIDDPFRTGKTYSVSQAAALAKVSHGTVRNWLFGGLEVEPVFGSSEKGRGDLALVSFLELSELIVAARFRRLKIRLQRIRDAHDFASKDWKVDYPFAHLNLQSIGGHILSKFEEEQPAPGGHFVVLSSPEQYLLPGLVSEELANFEYARDKFAARWFPFGREVPVVVDPRFSAGQPTIVDRGVRVDIVRRRWKAGETVSSIARDFELEPPQVEAVLQHVA